MPINPSNNRHILNNGRPTIAILTGSMGSDYQEGIMRGAAYVAEEKDYNIIAYCGGVIGSPDPLALARDTVFDLVDLDLISGLISPFSSNLRHLDQQQACQFIDRFSSVPIVNIGSYIEGYTNVITDYETGFIELFEHFYHVHGYRNILLIRGPKHHTSSEKRMSIYKKLLEKYSLPFCDEMVIYSDLNRIAARSSAEKFLNEAAIPFDAVIAINDSQALGVIDVLKERGLNVPEDVAVSGSMNTLEAAFSSPTLTSIIEPLFELGRAAVLEVIEQIEGRPHQGDIRIPTSLKIRQSCGCSSMSNHGLPQPPPKFDIIPLNSKYDPIISATKKDVKILVDQYKGGIAQESIYYLLQLYIEVIYDKKVDTFLKQLRLRLEKASRSEDVILWLTFTTKVQRSTLQYLKLEPESPELIELIAVLIGLNDEFSQIAIKYQRYETEYYLNYFRVVVNNLNSSFDLASVKNYTIDVLQLSELYISLFDHADPKLKYASNVFSVHNNNFIEIENKRFIANKLIPNEIESFQDRYSLMIFPLSFRRQSLGFMTVNLSNRKGTAFENLRAIISTALKNEILIQDLKNAEKRFSDIAHSTSNWLWETDAEHQFTYSSDSSSAVIGFTPEELIGKSINKLSVGAGDGNGYIQSMLNHENMTDLECWFKHQTEKVVCLLISAKPIMANGVFSGYRGVFEDITEQKFQEEKIHNLAYSDVLTALPNRSLFQDTLTETIAFSYQQSKKFALMFIDLDHFKNINDSMGHAAGDLLLIKVAERLKSSIRDRDTLARLGGDEFTIILPDLDGQKDVIDIAERIFRSIKDPLIIHDKSVHVTLSIGISIYPTDGVDPHSLLKHSDSAMYQAKSRGRNGYVFYDKLLEQRNTLRNIYEDTLREAIASGGFLLNYQPQVSAISGDVVGFEALVRIDSQRLGVVSPNHFIPLAEELGLIGQVDEWVFEHVCKQYADWRAQGLKQARLSVNLSALQLRNDSILDDYIKILKRYQVEPACVQLEITENALIDNEGVALKILNGFKSYGVSIALDDFGTGYSSFKCISLYPIDTVKIDRSFVKDAVVNSVNKAIIHGIASIARSLNMKVIAEGVETLEQYELIHLLGCDEIQGYYFYKPCSAEDAQGLL